MPETAANWVSETTVFIVEVFFIGLFGGFVFFLSESLIVAVLVQLVSVVVSIYLLFGHVDEIVQQHIDDLEDVGTSTE